MLFGNSSEGLEFRSLRLKGFQLSQIQLGEQPYTAASSTGQKVMLWIPSNNLMMTTAVII